MARLASFLSIPVNLWLWCLVPPEGAIQLEKKKQEEAEDLAKRKAEFRELVSVGAN